MPAEQPSYSATGPVGNRGSRGMTRLGEIVHVRINRKSIALGLATGLVVAAAGSVGASRSSTSGAAPEPVTGGHLTVSGDAEVSSPWTPAAMRCDSYCYTRARTFFDTLTVVGDDGQIYGMLAESVEPNEDFSEWTFTVREGITFTDGTPLDADAVIYNLQVTGTSLLVSAAVNDIAKVPDPEDPSRMILKIDKLDDMTFVIYTGRNGDPEQPISWRYLPYFLTSQLGLIASPTWLEAVAENPELAAQPVGTGPFIVDSYEPRSSLEVSRNPDYWMTDAAGNQLPYLDSMSFRVIEDSEVAVEAIQAGDVDILATSSGGPISTILDLGDEYTVTMQDRFAETGYALIDLDKPGPLQDRRVRCAMSLAVDRQELVDSTTDGFNEPSASWFSPGQQGYLDDNGAPIGQDLETASAMIAEYEEETGEQVSFTLGHIPSNTVSLGAELLAGWWSEIGIDVEDYAVPQADFINLAIFGTPEFEVFLWRGNGGGFLDAQYLWWHSSNARPDGELSLNFARLRDERVDAARQSLTDEEAIGAAEEINRIFAEECYTIPFQTIPWAVISDPSVHGVDTATLPDGTPLLDGQPGAGQFWTHSLYVTDE